MLDKLTRDQFAPLVGETFRLRLNEAEWVDVVLHDVQSLGARPADGWGREHNARTEPFSVVFRVPRELALPQMMFELSHATMGELPGLFLVPVAMDGNGRYYEAVFN
ncbi:MAG: hypothetical protein KDE56_05290 [Anaerolineales bacterium]|nr:hypothetical protein [Anaerolineales bacterium]